MRKAKSPAFTLIELLVVISIISLMISILLPALGAAKHSSQDIKCKVNLHGIATAATIFTADHEGRLVSHNVYNLDPHPDAIDWLNGNRTGDYSQAPQAGTLYYYLNNKDVYRCPTLPLGVQGSGVGSNGMFDYVFFGHFNGLQLDKMPRDCRFLNLDGSYQTNIITPLFSEEEPAFYANVNNPNMEGHHDNNDKLAHRHNGGANYAAADTSIHRFVEDPAANCHNWEARAHSGAWVELGGVGTESYGWWEGQ